MVLNCSALKFSLKQANGYATPHAKQARLLQLILVQVLYRSLDDLQQFRTSVYRTQDQRIERKECF